MRGIVIRRPCWRAYGRLCRRLSPGAPTTRGGRRGGRPGPHRWTAPVSRSGSQTIASWHQSPGGRGAAFATLSTTGRAPADLRDAITREQTEYPHDDRARDALEALAAWTEAKETEA